MREQDAGAKAGSQQRAARRCLQGIRLLHLTQSSGAGRDAAKVV
jgi:hypothetical protein